MNLKFHTFQNFELIVLNELFKVKLLLEFQLEYNA